MGVQLSVWTLHVLRPALVNAPLLPYALLFSPLEDLGLASLPRVGDAVRFLVAALLLVFGHVERFGVLVAQEEPEEALAKPPRELYLPKALHAHDVHAAFRDQDHDQRREQIYDGPQVGIRNELRRVRDGPVVLPAVPDDALDIDAFAGDLVRGYLVVWLYVRKRDAAVELLFHALLQHAKVVLDPVQYFFVRVPSSDDHDAARVDQRGADVRLGKKHDGLEAPRREKGVGHVLVHEVQGQTALHVRNVRRFRVMVLVVGNEIDEHALDAHNNPEYGVVEVVRLVEHNFARSQRRLVL